MAKMVQKYPPKAGLRRLREARGMSMDDLARKVGREKPLIYRLEKGFARYNETTLRAIAKALEISQQELLAADDADAQIGISPTPSRAPKAKPTQHSGFSEAGAAPFEHDAARHPPLPPLAPTQSRYRVLSRDLSEKGLVPGQVITVEPRSDWRDNIEDGDALLVRLNGELQLRQYLGPDFLVTNSSGVLSAVRISGHDVQLIGKIVGNVGW